MAFRAWNRGLASTVATTLSGGVRQATLYGVWSFNGTRWTPNLTFPGEAKCPGKSVLWAGKLDYWLIGGGFEGETPPGGGEPPHKEVNHLCRFDGSTLEWEELEIPKPTREHVRELGGGLGAANLRSGACFAWNDCWFFGSYGTVVHWNGAVLSDASPPASLGWLQGEFTGAAAGEDPLGKPFGLAVTAAREEFESQHSGLPAQPGGAAAPQLYASEGGAFSPLDFEPPQGEPSAGGTDLVAVGLDSTGGAWAAGNPTGWRAEEPQRSGRPFAGHSPLPSPVIPLPSAGACTGPPGNRFTFEPFTTQQTASSFLWASIAVVPGLDEALAGGQVQPAGPAGEYEAAIARAGCDGTTSVTRFGTDRLGYFTAIAANASNDGWAASSQGASASGVREPPHLYRLSDGEPPAAPEGDDNETRPFEEEPPATIVIVEPPPPPPPPPPPTTVTQTHNVKLPPALYHVRVKLHAARRHGREYLSLYLTFRLRRPVTVGARALRHGRVVSVAKPRLFQGSRGLLVLKLDRRHWPTKVGFIA